MDIHKPGDSVLFLVRSIPGTKRPIKWGPMAGAFPTLVSSIGNPAPEVEPACLLVDITITVTFNTTQYFTSLL